MSIIYIYNIVYNKYKLIYILNLYMDIFVKNKQLLYNDVKSIIPNGSLNKPLKDDNKIEYRWRFIIYNQNKYVEISKKENDYREYKDNNGEWVKRNIDSRFDKYVVESYYYYIDK